MSRMDRLWDEFYVARHSKDRRRIAAAKIAIVRAAVSDLVVAVNRYRPGLGEDDWHAIFAVADEVMAARDD